MPPTSSPAPFAGKQAATKLQPAVAETAVAPLPAATPAEMAKQAGLVYVSDRAPGYGRRRAGRGFSFYDAKGNTVRDPRLRERFLALAIPPAWTEVWICRNPKGHLQAVGRDAAGRKQYIYHPAWAEIRSRVKYSKLLAFGEALPELRKQVARDLRKRSLTRGKVTALVIKLMEQTLIRIGNDEYARTNETYGLTTLLDDHAQIEGDTVTFEFRGKSGKAHSIALRNPRFARLVKQCQELPGQRLFQYWDEQGELAALTSTDVNNYLREATGYDFTAKDFRTWGGTLLAARRLRACEDCTDERAQTQAIQQMIKEVAEALGNTPAVCRAHYVHPAILDAFRQQRLAGHYAAIESEDAALPVEPDEQVLLAVLQECSE
jgi:DNA topoisomerase-1